MTPETTEPAGFDQAIEVAVEAEIGEFVRRDGARLRRTPETDSELVANSAVMLVQRMGVREIDRLIAELQTLRALLQEVGERAQRKLAEYAHLCQSATQSTKVIADSLKQLKPAQNDATLTARNSLPTLQRRTDPPPARSSLPALPHRTDSLSKAAPSNERRRRAWGWPRKQELAPHKSVKLVTHSAIDPVNTQARDGCKLLSGDWLSPCADIHPGMFPLVNSSRELID